MFSESDKLNATARPMIEIAEATVRLFITSRALRVLANIAARKKKACVWIGAGVSQTPSTKRTIFGLVISSLVRPTLVLRVPLSRGKKNVPFDRWRRISHGARNATVRPRHSAGSTRMARPAARHRRHVRERNE